MKRLPISITDRPAENETRCRIGLRATAWVRALFALSLVCGFTSTTAIAAKPETEFAGQVVILDTKPPTRFASQSKFTQWLKKHRQKYLKANKKNAKSWTLEYFAFLKAPANDVELRVKFFDITAQKTFVAGDSLFVTGRDQRVISARLQLKEPPFKRERKYQIYVTDSRNYVLAKAIFWLKAPKERHSGRVNFADEDVKPKPTP